MIPTASKRAERVEAADQVHHHQREERDVCGRAGTAHRAQEARIDAFEHQRPVDHGERQKRDRGDAGDQQQSRIVERQHGAEQEMQQIDVGALERHDGDADRQRNEEEGGERSVFLQFGCPRDDAGADRDHETGDQPARRHGEQRQAGDEKADRRAWQDRVRHRVADQAHPPQHQEHADRAGPERERERADQRAAHERELDEGADERVVEHRATPRTRAPARRTPRTCGVLSAGSPPSARRRLRPTPPARAPAAALRETST